MCVQKPDNFEMECCNFQGRAAHTGPGFLSEIVVHETGCTKDTDLARIYHTAGVSAKIECHSMTQRFQLRPCQSA